MFIGGKMTFQSTFYITSLFWCVLILFLKTKSLVGVIKIVSILSIYKIFNYLFFTDLINNSTYKKLNTDVLAQWLDLASMIYENNYFFT